MRYRATWQRKGSTHLHNLQINTIHTLDTSFEELFKHPYPKLCLFAVGLVKDDAIAEDLVQESFIRVWNSKETVEPIPPSLAPGKYSISVKAKDMFGRIFTSEKEFRITK